MSLCFPFQQILSNHFVCCTYCLHDLTSHLLLNSLYLGFCPHLSKNASSKSPTTSSCQNQRRQDTVYLHLRDTSAACATRTNPFLLNSLSSCDLTLYGFPPTSLDTPFPFHLLALSFLSKLKTVYLLSLHGINAVYVLMTPKFLLTRQTSTLSSALTSNVHLTPLLGGLPGIPMAPSKS